MQIIRISINKGCEWVINLKHQILRIGLPGNFIGHQTGRRHLSSHSAEVLTELRLCSCTYHKSRELFMRTQKFPQSWRSFPYVTWTFVNNFLLPPVWHLHFQRLIPINSRVYWGCSGAYYYSPESNFSWIELTAGYLLLSMPLVQRRIKRSVVIQTCIKHAKKVSGI